MKCKIYVYTAFVTCSHLYVKGRILKNEPPISKHSHGVLSSLFHTILRALSREVSNAKVTVSIGDIRYDITTDDEGYYEVFENIEDQIISSDTIQVDYLIKSHKVQTACNLNSLQSDVPVGIISDIDDTAMVTGVKSFFKIRLLINTIFINPFRRKPIQNAGEAFHLLSKNVSGKGPVIYLSNSPWNLYDYLKTFLQHNNFPSGIILLRDMGWNALKKKSIVEMNKFVELERILVAFSETNFILIGDTGEYDFDIYTTIANKYPDRILKIIMNKAGNKGNENRIQAAIDNNNVNSDIQLVNGYKKLNI